jgi:hypothetical protein
MRNLLSARLLFPAGIVGLAMSLGACSATTYGTGTTPGKQTFDDIAGMVSLSGKKAPPIDYKPRGPIVAPPATAALPKPGSDMVATGPDWPRDPDALNAARKAAAGSAAPGADPGFRLPKTAESEIKPRYNDYDAGKEAYKENINVAAQKKMFATAKGSGAVDANGNPIRTSLTEPPATYRAPDPNAPTEFNNNSATGPPKKHWYWPF